MGAKGKKDDNKEPLHTRRTAQDESVAHGGRPQFGRDERDLEGCWGTLGCTKWW